MQNFDIFTKAVTAAPELYNSENTFYIQMKNANNQTRAAYNKIKNALMSYVSKMDQDICVTASLQEKEESFSNGDLLAKFLIVNGQLRLHLKADPNKHGIDDQMFRVAGNQMIVYSLQDEQSVGFAFTAIQKVMSETEFVSASGSQQEDYASYYDKTIPEIHDVVQEAQRRYEANAEARRKEEEQASASYFDNSMLPSKEEIKQAEKERKERKRQAKRIKIWDELAECGYNFVWLRYVEFYAVAIFAAIGLGVLYQLKLPWMIALAIGFCLLMPGVIKAFYRNKYEEKRYDDVTTYIEQMLYSFRKNSKITVSLQDTLSVFPEGKMHDTIAEAIEYTRNSTSGGNLYREALKVIEKVYPCRRVRSLHRYMIKVEGVGGDHDAGVEALLKDRRLWVERVESFKKESKTVLMDVYIALGFSIGLAALIVRLMATPMVDVPSNLFYQVTSFAFLFICGWTIRAVTKATIFTLEDEEDEANSKRLVQKLNWIRNYDPQVEFKKVMKLSCVFVAFFAVGFFMGSALVMGIAIAAICYALFVKRYLDKRSAIKSICRAVEKAYPDWLLELALLLQIDNLHVSIQKTLDSAPLILRKDLAKLADDIIKDPASIDPYVKFLNFLPLNQVHSSMKLLYSISEFGQHKGSVQLMELVERNSILMDKAEKYRNDDRLAKTFIIKFIPMGISSMKLMCDLVVMLVSYMSILTNAM